MTYEEALAYIHSVDWKGSRPGLERISELTERLGHPERDLTFIHIAGTNGKGSVSAMLDSILRAAGYRVGLFTSPYIERFNERIRFDGEDISDEDLARDTETVKNCADQMEDAPTEFELITAIAFVYYRRIGCDFVVLECGLGGRLDSTNVIDTSILSVITGIALDHCAILGDTTEKIAAEKAGIIKPGVPVLLGEADEGATDVIRKTAGAKESPFVRVDFEGITDISASLSGTSFRYFGRDVKTALTGLYQTRNTATVLRAVELLRQSGVKIPESSVAEGLSRVRWKARMEVLHAADPLMVYDGAHNPQGVSGAAENIRSLLSPLSEDGRIGLLMGVMADKDHRDMIRTLSSFAAFAVTVRPDNARSLDPQSAAREFRECGVTAESGADLAEAVRRAVGLARESKRPLLCLGSLYMYADVKRAAAELFAEEE
ncbi:MAG: bifunctional folylpolyglutamate synthase/dihydrofolate synthase [Ruminococcaceae bacterium]|jgi:dihydrofolate synthase/folylpolyglutamate synthase|nr:bifunctional folylpolyglutamate synthase/dihydrofolate synthase [Oscillospiraceae bacterium]